MNINSQGDGRTELLKKLWNAQEKSLPLFNNIIDCMIKHSNGVLSRNTEDEKKINEGSYYLVQKGACLKNEKNHQIIEFSQVIFMGSVFHGLTYFKEKIIAPSFLYLTDEGKKKCLIKLRDGGLELLDANYHFVWKNYHNCEINCIGKSKEDVNEIKAEFKKKIEEAVKTK